MNHHKRQGWGLQCQSPTMGGVWTRPARCSGSSSGICSKILVIQAGVVKTKTKDCHESKAYSSSSGSSPCKHNPSERQAAQGQQACRRQGLLQAQNQETGIESKENWGPILLGVVPELERRSGNDQLGGKNQNGTSACNEAIAVKTSQPIIQRLTPRG